MRNTVKVVLASVLLAGTGVPTYAAGLVGGLVGADNALITINEGSAADTGLVNLGLGGGNGNILDLSVGSGEPLATSAVGTGNSVLGADVSIRNLAHATANVGGNGGLVEADVNLLSGFANGNVNVGGPNLIGLNVGLQPSDGPTQTSLNPLPKPGGANVSGEVIGAGALASGGNGDAMPSCTNGSANDVARLIRDTRADASWAQASGVRVQRVDLCPEVKVWLAAQLQGSVLGNALRTAVQSDALLNASLSRTSYGAERVFAINEKGGQLVLYVY
jgi:hypothetical protein